jgi:hypothetical protein
VLPKLPLNEINYFVHHNSYNKCPNLRPIASQKALPNSNFLLTIRFPETHITSASHSTLLEHQWSKRGHCWAFGDNIQTPNISLFFECSLVRTSLWSLSSFFAKFRNYTFRSYRLHWRQLTSCKTMTPITKWKYVENKDFIGRANYFFSTLPVRPCAA